MARIGRGIEVDEENLFITCVPETACQTLLSKLESSGLTLGAYPATSESESIGEWVMKRGASIGSFAFGGPEEQVLSLGVVLGNGKSIETGYKRVLTFSMGYDLNKLFVGSNGSLGKLSSVTLRAIPAWRKIQPISYSFPDPLQLLDALKRIISSRTSPYHVSFSITSERIGDGPSFIIDVIYAGYNETLNAEQENLTSELKEIDSTPLEESIALERWRNRFTLRRISNEQHFILEEGFLPLKNFEDFRAHVHQISGNLALHCILLDRNMLAVSVSFPEARKEEINIEEKRTKIGYAIQIMGGYQLGLKAWLEKYREKEDTEAAARIMALVRTAFGGGGASSSGMDAIISEYNIQKDISHWKSGMSRSRLGQLMPRRCRTFNDSLIEELESIVGADYLAVDTWKRYYYTHDLAPLPKIVELAFQMLPDVVVRPVNESQIKQIIQLARRERIPVIGRGAGSWGFGGAICTQGGIMLDLSSMNRITRIDDDAFLAYCEPGVTWEKLATEAERRGLMIGACPSSFPVATIGGWTNTGGAGIGTYKHGTAYSQVRYIRAVMPDGQILNTMKHGTSNRGPGLDLNALFSGSEGTIGILTKIAVQLHPKAEEVRPLAYSFDNVYKLQEPLIRITHSNTIPYNISFYDENNFEFLRRLGKEVPAVGAMLSIALRGESAVNDVDEKVLDNIMNKAGGRKESEEIARHEWEERSYEMRIRRLGPGGTIGEGVIPLTAFSEMMQRAARISKEMRIKSTLRGVVVDRNSVAFMPFYLSNEMFGIESLASMGFVKRVIEEARKLGGRASGIGVWFAWNLDKLRGIEGARLIRNLKTLIDNDNIMNPGKMTEMRMRWGIPIPGFLMDAGLNLLAMAKKALPRTKTAMNMEE